jgi:hypothetical protein
MTRVLNRVPQPLHAAMPGIPEPVGQLVSRMLTKDREQRGVSLDDVRSAFALGSRPAVHRSRGRRVLIPVSVSVAGVAAVAVVLFLALGWGGRSSEHKGVPASESEADTDSAAVSDDSALTLVEVQTPAVGRDDSVPVTPSATPLTERPKPEPVTAGMLNLVVVPWAEVLLDGNLIGVTPLSGPIRLAQGRHELELRNPYFPVLRKTVDLASPDTALTINLNREFAMVEVVVVPWAVVEIDGQVVDTTPMSRAVPLIPGEHVLKLTHPEIGSRTATIAADSTGSYRFSFVLEEM